LQTIFDPLRTVLNETKDFVTYAPLTSRNEGLPCPIALPIEGRNAD